MSEVYNSDFAKSVLARMDRNKPFSGDEFFREIDKILKNSNLPEYENIDYTISSARNLYFWDNEFEIYSITKYGGNEGIYTDIYVRGDIANFLPKEFIKKETVDENRLGTIKTLDTSKDAFLDMHKLGAEFVYAANEYINEHSLNFIFNGYYACSEKSAFGLFGNHLDKLKERVERACTDNVEYVIADLRSRKIVAGNKGMPSLSAKKPKGPKL